MEKRSSDEPDDKALQRLRQFEDQRKAVPGEKSEDEGEKKSKKKGAKKLKGKDKPDSATDLLKGM